MVQEMRPNTYTALQGQATVLVSDSDRPCPTHHPIHPSGSQRVMPDGRRVPRIVPHPARQHHQQALNPRLPVLRSHSHNHRTESTHKRTWSKEESGMKRRTRATHLQFLHLLLELVHRHPLHLLHHRLHPLHARLHARDGRYPFPPRPEQRPERAPLAHRRHLARARRIDRGERSPARAGRRRGRQAPDGGDRSAAARGAAALRLARGERHARRAAELVRGRLWRRRVRARRAVAQRQGLVRLGAAHGALVQCEGRGGEVVQLVEAVAVLLVGSEEVVVLAVEVDVEDRLVHVHGGRAEEVEERHVLDAAREAVVEVVRALGARLAPLLTAGEETFVDRDDDELWERLETYIVSLSCWNDGNETGSAHR